MKAGGIVATVLRDLAYQASNCFNAESVRQEWYSPYKSLGWKMVLKTLTLNLRLWAGLFHRCFMSLISWLQADSLKVRLSFWMPALLIFTPRYVVELTCGTGLPFPSWTCLV